MKVERKHFYSNNDGTGVFIEVNTVKRTLEYLMSRPRKFIIGEGHVIEGVTMRDLCEHFYDVLNFKENGKNG